MERVLLSAIGGFVSGLVVGIPVVYFLDRIGFDILEPKYFLVHLGFTLPVSVALALLVVNPFLYRLAGV